MHKGDLSREFYPNFTYQIEKKAFWYVYTGLPRRPLGLLAMSRTNPRAYRVLLFKTRDL